MKCLITGGAGFIGSHTADALLRDGHAVRVLDSLALPMHRKGKPAYLSPDLELVIGDVCDRETLTRALEGVDAVFHFAAYQDYLPDFSTFYRVNAVGTALLYEVIVERRLPVRKVILASSQAVAGEGLYQDADGRLFSPDMRPEAQLATGAWEISDAQGRPAQWVPTPESVANPQNPYGMSKQAAERMALHLGRRYGIPSVAMRYSIVQGPRQSFYNAYSGACRIFCLNLWFDRPPVLYEDGRQVRDFVNIADVVDANLLVLRDSRADYRVFHVGGGRAYTIEEFAGLCLRAFDKTFEPLCPGLYRYGDTRHIFSDISALSALGWTPRRGAEESVRDYLAYLREQTDIEDILAFAEATMKNLNVVRTVQ